jgi:hypothetical protein
MIEKLLPRVLNTSSDNRLKKKNEMNDAYNVVVTEDFNEFDDANASTSTGNEGVLKPAKGTQAVDGDVLLTEAFGAQGFDDAQVVGQIPDPRTGVVYFFLSAAQDQREGVYAYDANNYFGTGSDRWVVIHLFKTKAGRFFDGDIVHVSDGEGGFRPYLYFVNNVDEPFRLDVLLARQYYTDNFEWELGGQAWNEGSSALYSEYDFIRACPKAPMHPITFQFEREDQEQSSNFRKVPGFQFAYQCIYNTGEESAISTYSDVAVPPEYIRQSVFATQIELSNICRLFIPSAVDGAVNYTQNVERIRILVREGNDGALFVVDEVDANPLGVVEYEFRNDRVLTGVTVEEENKLYDALPRTAETCAVVEDRLFYGNYVENFDEPNIEATVQVQYANKPNSFDDMEVTITPVIVPLHANTSLNPTPPPQQNPGPVAQYVSNIPQRVSGIVVDVNNVPDVIPADTFVFVSITFDPGRSYEMYNSENSYHASRIVNTHPVDGPIGQGLATIASTYNAADYAGAVNGELLQGPEGRLRLAGRNKGVGAPNLKWRVTESGTPGDLDAVIGCSPASALKFPGQKVNFNMEFRITEDITNGKEVILNAIVRGFDPNQDPQGVEYIQISNTPSIDWDHGFLDPTEVPGYDDLPQEVKSNITNLSMDVPPGLLENTSIRPKGGGDQLDKARLIFPVFDDTIDRLSGAANFELDINGVDFDLPEPPCGYGIINSANVSFSLRSITHGLGYQDNRAVMTLEVLDVSALDVRTCIPIIEPATLTLGGWRVYSGDYLSTYLISDVNQTGTSEPDINISYHFHDFGNSNPLFDAGAAPFNRKSTIGYLHSGNGGEVEDEDIYMTPNRLRSEAGPLVGIISNDGGFNILTPDLFGFSLLDGEHGLLVKEKKRTLDSSLNGGVTLQYSLTIDDDALTNIPEVGCYGFDQIMLGYAAFRNNLNVYYNSSQSPTIPILVGEEVVAANLSPNTAFNQNRFEIHELSGNQYILSETDDELRQEVEVIYDAYLTESEEVGAYRTFKSHAFHDFGIVYYDERGRPGNVNRLPSVYVAGYSNEERGSAKGRSQVQIDITSAPPPWAWNYQIVYAGNSTVRDFIQYTVGGAFRPVNTGEEDDVPARNIYVSLNYLQGNDSVSYAKNFGARAPDGTQNLYVYAPGDFLRVISYFEDAEEVKYPNNLIFEVLDVVTLGTDPDENPLVASGEVPPHLRGQFLVLKDNNRINGFSFNDVRNADNDDPQSNEHYWNNRCIVEIISPRAVIDPENKVYHEIGEVYNVGRSEDLGIYHQRPTVVLSNGDVWWRRVPLNQTDYDPEEQVFIGLIQDEEGTTEPRFKQYYLETKTFNDTFPGTDVNGFGKRKFYSTESAEVRRFSSVTFGDKNNPSSRRLRYTSFNAYLAPFKDLPNEHGAIHRILNYSDSLFVVQNNKASNIPISRNVLSDALGSDTLVTSNVVMGEQIFYAGSFGCDNNPESVLRVDNTIYFANKRKAEVYRFNPSNGVQVISRKGMDSFFKDAFEDIMESTTFDIPAGNFGPLSEDQIMVVSGYDPLKDEYVLTIARGYGRLGTLQPGELINSQVELPIQIDLPVLTAAEDYQESYPEGDGTTDSGGGGGDSGGGGGDSGGGPDEEVSLIQPYPINFSPFFSAVNSITSGWLQTYGYQEQYLAASVNLPYVENPATPSGILELSNFSLLSLYQPATRTLDVSPLVSEAIAISIGDRNISSFTGQGQTTVATFDSSTRTINVNSSYHNNVLGYGNPFGSSPDQIQAGLWDLIRVDSQGPSTASVASAAAYWSGELPTTLGGHMWINAYNYRDLAIASKANTRISGDQALYFSASVGPNGFGFLYPTLGTVSQLIAEINNNYSDNALLTSWASELQADLNLANGTFAQQTINNLSVPVTQPVSGVAVDVVNGYGVDYDLIDPNSAEGLNSPFNLWLTQMVNLVSDLQETHDSVNPNEGITAGQVFDVLTNRITSLEATVDVLTDQIEEASSSPTVGIDGGTPLIDGVVSNNDNTLSRAVLAQGGGFGDRVLTADDVRSASLLAAQFEFLTANGLELTGDLVRSILRQFHSDVRQTSEQLADDAGLTSFSRSTQVNPDVGLEDGVEGFGLSKLLSGARSDLFPDGIVGSGDILVVLSDFGQVAGQTYQDELTQQQYIDLTNAIADFFNQQ